MKLYLMPKKFYGKIVYLPMCVLSQGLSKLCRDKRVKNHVFLEREVKLLIELGFELELIQGVDPAFEEAEKKLRESS